MKLDDRLDFEDGFRIIMYARDEINCGVIFLCFFNFAASALKTF